MLRKLATLRFFAVPCLFVLVFALVAVPATHTQADDGSGGGGGGKGISAAPSPETPDWQATPPALSDEQVTQREAEIQRTHLPGPILENGNEGAAPQAETRQPPASRPAGPSALQPGSPQTYRNINFGATIPDASQSNVMESSVGQAGRYIFYAGNWFASRSINGGVTWTYVNPYTGFPTPGFCCDQIVQYDGARDTHFWYRQGVRNASGVNIIRLGVSNDGGATFCNYDFTPTNFNSTFTGEWFDYPHIQVGPDWLYISTNTFNNAGNFVRSMMIRLNLDQLDACAPVSWWYYWNSGWFTFMPVQGSDHIAYFASNWPTALPQNNRIAIWRWDERTNGLPAAPVVRTLANTFLAGGTSICGTTAGNWMSRSDFRLKAGARYMAQNSNLLYPGRNVIGFWWNVNAGGSFPHPYIEGAAFFENTLLQVPGNQGRPLVWNSTQCLAYPSVAANKRGDLAMVMNYGTGTAQNPSVAYAFADDYTTAVPGWTYYGVATSGHRPADSRGGDYNTVRVFEPSQRSWVGAAHYLPGTTGISQPIYFAFGRSRDYQSWLRWQN